MRDLPLWAQLATALVAITFVLSFLRSLAAYIIDVVTIHTLKCDVAAIQIRQYKQLRALQEGIHPGDIFGEDHSLDSLLIAAMTPEITDQAPAGSQKSARATPKAAPSAPGTPPAEPQPEAVKPAEPVATRQAA